MYQQEWNGNPSILTAPLGKPERKPFNSKFTVDENGQIIPRPKRTYCKKPKFGPENKPGQTPKRKYEKKQMTEPVIQLLKQYDVDVSNEPQPDGSARRIRRRKNSETETERQEKKKESCKEFPIEDPADSWKRPDERKREWFEKVDFTVLSGNKPCTDETATSREQLFPYTLNVTERLPSIETLYMSVYGQGRYQ